MQSVEIELALSLLLEFVKRLGLTQGCKGELTHLEDVQRIQIELNRMCECNLFIQKVFYNHRKMN